MNLPNPLSFLHASSTEPPSLDFILPGFIPGTVAGLVSPGGTGKSFFALELACAVAGGEECNLLKLPVTGTGVIVDCCVWRGQGKMAYPDGRQDHQPFWKEWIRHGKEYRS